MHADSASQPTLTVFTPSYNGAATLPRVFESLRQQTSRDFLWLLVDDGSADATGALAAGWKDQAQFRWDPLESTCRHASLSIL